MAGSTAIDPALVERFKAALDRLNPDCGKIGLAVSGGPDSLAMLVLAHEAIPGAFEVATVDHGLRPEAKDECALVEVACKERGIPCEVLIVEVGKGNLQSEAREARYSALAEWATRRSLKAVATAHHADDQAETLLMRLNRGSGVSGLAGVREAGYFRSQDDQITLLRPLLDWRRSTLRQVVDNAALAFASDPSNFDGAFERVRIRRAIADAEWLDPIALSRSAAHLADADQALDDMAMLAWNDMVERDEECFKVRPIEPKVISLRVLQRIFQEYGATPRGSDLAALLERLEAGTGSNLAGVMAERKHDEVFGHHWVFRPEPPRKTG